MSTQKKKAQKKAPATLTVEEAAYKLEKTKEIIEGWIMSFEDADLEERLPKKASGAISSLYDTSRILKVTNGENHIG